MAPKTHIQPMLATMLEEPFRKTGWIFEIKWDGYRGIAEIDRGDVRLYSRNALDYRKKFPAIVESLARIPVQAILDGELVGLDAQGVPDFAILHADQRKPKGTIAYYVFDLLELDGVDLRHRPLKERRATLEKLLKEHPQPNLRMSDHIETDGVSFLKVVEAQGLEGIVGKKADSKYREGARNGDWVKIKIRRRQEAVICGFTAPKGTRVGFGALVLGVYEKGELKFIGKAGSGLDAKHLQKLRVQLDAMKIAKCPISPRPKVDGPVTWVRPELVCEIAFQNWTDDGHARHPTFLGLRDDKAAESVERERPAPPPLQEFPEGNFTNLEKVYWPKEGYTKGDVLRYYHDVADFILPCMKDRPVSLNRHPDGIAKPNFFQKDMSRQKLPAFAETVVIPSDEKDLSYLVCRNAETILYMANLGCIEMNPWNSRVGSLDHPDFLIIDLDPQDVHFPKVVEVAQKVREFLEKHCGPCFCKTSGKRGLHVYLPLIPKHDHSQVVAFAHLVVQWMNRQNPESTSLMRSPALRRGKIYLDWLQNRRGQTIAAPYSLRPIEGAPVSTPLRWDEVDAKLDPTRFTIATMRKRLDEVGDLWEGMRKEKVDLAQALQSMREIDHEDLP